MSLIHYLTIGRFEFTEEEPPFNLMQRVVDHFIVDGLKQLHRSYKVIKPFSMMEIFELEEEMAERFGLELNLRQYLTEDGLLKIIYQEMFFWFESFAEHVALIASERFGAIASDRGHVFEPEKIKEMSDRLLIQKAERARLFQIEDGAESIREIIKAYKRPDEDPRRISSGISLKAALRSPQSSVAELIKSLTDPNPDVRFFVGLALEKFGESAKQAIPVITNLLKDPDSNLSFTVVDALGEMGKEAEPALVLALKHKIPRVRKSAIESFGNLIDVSEHSISILQKIAEQKNEEGNLARKTLAKLSKSP